jgi:hypothetical protein
MRRLFWLALGLGAGATGAVLFSRWLQRQVERFAPPNLARQAKGMLSSASGDLTGSLGGAMEAFREGMAEREAEIRSTARED